jgi:outer membrane protein OmpA-like peptidoglycan-associated protein
MNVLKILTSATILLLAQTLSAQETFDSLFLLDKAEVFFDVNQHTLQPGADTALAGIADKCRTTTRRFLRIEAHTDADGSDAFNQDLSRRRAETVRNYLESLGLSGVQLEVTPFGERRPAAANDTEEGKRLNRRVTVELWQRTQMTWLEGQVVDKETSEGIQATLILRSRFLNDSLQTDTAGFFRAPVPDKIPVEVSLFSRGYFFETQTLQPNSLRPIKVNFALPPALEGEVLTLKDLYFVGNQDTLLKSSEPQLPKLSKFMEQNPGIRIEIAGHINHPNSPPVPKDSWNFGLSERRAKRVYNYLIEHGIDAERVTYKGYGNYQMIYPLARTEKEQAMNRRVEIRVLDNPGKRR